MMENNYTEKDLVLLDENEMGEKLYLIDTEIFLTSVLITADGQFWVLSNMQGWYPETLEDARYEDWFRIEDVNW